MNFSSEIDGALRELRDAEHNFARAISTAQDALTRTASLLRRAEIPPPPPDTDRHGMSAQLIAAFTLDAPVPCRVLYGLYGSRTTFHNWKTLGLDIKNVEGMGPTVRPSTFKAFLLKLRDDAAPIQPTTNQ